MKPLKSLAILGAALGILAWAGPSHAVGKSGITGAAFLKIGVGARAVSLGSACTTVPNDVNQMFWNPAGMALKSGRTQLTYSYNQWIADLGHHAVGVARGFGDWGTVGIGVINLSLNNIDNSNGLDRDQVPAFLSGSYTGFRDTGTGSYDYSDLALQVSWARDVTDRLSTGATVKWIRESIDTEAANAFAVDFGVIYDLGYRHARIGARINNLGSDLKFYDIGAPLPLEFSIGGAIDVYDAPDQGLRVTILSDATKPQDSDQLLYSAAEVEVFNHLVLRGGYKLNYAGVNDQKIDESTNTTFDAPRTEEGMTLGAGVQIPWSGYQAIVDYAYTDFGILSQVHRVSLRLDF